MHKGEVTVTQSVPQLLGTLGPMFLAPVHVEEPGGSHDRSTQAVTLLSNCAENRGLHQSKRLYGVPQLVLILPIVFNNIDWGGVEQSV